MTKVLKGCIMKKLLLLFAALVSSGLCLAQEAARVISSTPVTQQVGVPRQVCTSDQVAGQQQASGVEAGMQQCTTQSFFENRTVGYNVIYEYAGKQYSVQLPNDPGPTLQLQVSPVTQMAPAVGTVTYVQPAYPQPGYVVVPPDYYPGYYAPGYYQPDYFLPFAIGLGFGIWGGGYGGHGFGHGGYGGRGGHGHGR